MLRLNPDGSYDWNTFYGGDSSDVGCNLAYYDNAIYLIGYSWGSWQADGQAPLHSYNGHKDILILKLDAVGNYLWHTFYGGESFDVYEDIAVNPNGVYASAYSYSTWVGDGDAQPIHDCSAGGEQALLKLSHSGAYGWHTFYCGYSHGITIDDHEDILLAGDSSINWLGDGDAQPLHAHTISGRNYSVLKLSQPDEQAEIPISGGTLSYSSGSGRSTTVQVPPNAITDTITLVYTQWDADNPPTGMGYAGLGFTDKAYEDQILQPGYTFSVPVTVTATYTESDIIGLDEDTLLLYNWDNSTNTWKDVALTCSPPSSYERFPTENRLVVPICHLSRFALFGGFHINLFFPLILKKLRQGS